MQYLKEKLGDHLQENVSLSRFTAARLGGPADYLYIARSGSLEELAELIRLAWSRAIPTRVLGGGANVLVSDKGFRGLIIINRLANIRFDNWFGDRNLSVSSGASLTHLSRQCQLHGYAGMEWAISVPGSLGGAIVNNAGAHGASIADHIRDIVVLESEFGPRLYSLADLQYEYRTSMLKKRSQASFFVLQANFVLPADDPAEIAQRMQTFSQYRKQSQPPGASLGSIFKNPKDDFAGRLIESSGLKGTRIGNVEVSTKHANFFVNHGDSRAQDYYDLICLVRDRVYQHHWIELELEIELLGDWST